ncbi:MAG: HpcH/HpaI aldolase family protein [Shimia sp.]
MIGAPANPVKAALLAGRRIEGVWLTSGAPSVAELAGWAGLDWALVDAEHGPSGFDAVVAQVRALAATTTPAIVRPPSRDATYLRRLCDAGVQTVLVPMVDDADLAREVARALRYPPEGTRGMGAALARASLWGGRDAYAATANDGMCCIAQIETARALANLEAIAAVPGIDVLFVGPLDLAADMGHPGAPDHPDVARAIADARARIAAAGLPAGIIAFDPADRDRRRGEGWAFLGLGCDMILLRAALAGLRG